MERRIKILSILTILAIIVFLGMQIYWLYNRYLFALREYEGELSERIERCVEEYNSIRERTSENRSLTLNKGNRPEVFTVPTFSLQQEYGDTVTTTRKAKISTYLFSAHELLGLEPGTPLDDEQKKRAVDLAQVQMVNPVDSVVFDASGAKDENEAWLATKNVQTERKSPFSVKGIDSVLRKSKIEGLILLERRDSMIWGVKKEFNLSLVSPRLVITIPYSQLQGYAVKIISGINPLDVLPGMWQTMSIAIVISASLILCLVYQFSTVLKLSRLDKMRRNFITTMIHELKRPISTLKMCVSGLDNERMMEDKEFKGELIGETKTALDNLSAYFSKLRDITFNEAEQIPLNVETVNLHNLFEKVGKSIVISPDKEVKMKNEIDEDIEISGDSSHFFNIISNLVENAVKYSGEIVEITGRVIKSDEMVALWISDTGNGIPSGELKHIFKRFFRGKELAGEQPGMGLGLAYVKLLVEAHGGKIEVESEEGKGSCFKIILPQ